MSEQFAVAGPLDVAIRLGSGRVEISRAEPGAATASVEPVDPDHEPSVRVAAGTRVHLSGSSLSIEALDGRAFRRAQVRIMLTLPAGSEVSVRAGLATVHVRDGLAALAVKLGTGDVDVDEVSGELTVKAGQADVVVGSAGSVSVATGRGLLRAQRVGDAAFRTGQGLVELGRTEGRVHVKGGAVQLDVREAGPGEVVLDTGSGGGRVGVVAGTTVQVDLTSGSGDVRCDLPLDQNGPTGGAGLRLRLRTGHGDLLVATAPTP
jgi:hypothetical protein